MGYMHLGPSRQTGRDVPPNENSNLECRDAKQVQHENMVITDWNDNKPLSMYMYILDHFFSQCFQRFNC